MMLGARSLWGLLLGIVLGLQGCSQEPPQVRLGTQAAAMQKEGKGCVEPTEVMRARHMDFLFHQRDATLHAGIRTVKHSLNACVACHSTQDAHGKPVPINAEGQFCQACHAYASVSLDCFDCHATKPAPGTSAVAGGSVRAAPAAVVPAAISTPVVGAVDPASVSGVPVQPVPESAPAVDPVSAVVAPVVSSQQAIPVEPAPADEASARRLPVIPAWAPPAGLPTPALHP